MYRKPSLIVFALVLSSAAASAADTTLISRVSQKKESNGISREPAISQTGQFVAFRSSATNLDRDRCDRGIYQIYVSDRMKQKMLQHLVNNQVPDEEGSPLDHLSDRELEVFQLLGNGFATRQIAE